VGAWTLSTALVVLEPVRVSGCRVDQIAGGREGGGGTGESRDLATTPRRLAAGTNGVGEEERVKRAPLKERGLEVFHQEVCPTRRW
jgi:hypothetical protein